MRHRVGVLNASIVALCAGCADPEPSTPGVDASFQAPDSGGATAMDGHEGGASATSGDATALTPSSTALTDGDVLTSDGGDASVSSLLDATSEVEPSRDAADDAANSSSDNGTSSSATSSSAMSSSATSSSDDTATPAVTTVSESATIDGGCDGGDCDAGTTPGEADGDRGPLMEGPVCGSGVDAANGTALSDVLPQYLEQADAGVEAPCYPPCVMALLDSCRPSGECTNSGQDVSCWDNGVGQHQTTTNDGETVTITETAFVDGAPCITGTSELDLVTPANYYKWWDGAGNLVATAEYSEETYDFLVWCEGEEQPYISDRYTESCGMLGNAVFSMCPN